MANFDAEQKTPQPFQSGNQVGEASRFTLATIFYYKMQASCSSAASGYITWVNQSGDDSGKPACGGVLGPSVQIGKWAAT